MIELKLEHSECLILSMSDDIFIAGPPVAATAAFRDWVQMVRNAGGQPSIGKCKAWSPSPDSLMHHEVVALGNPENGTGVEICEAHTGLRVVGHPLGTDTFCRNFYMQQASDSAEISTAIEDLCAYDNPLSLQTAYLALRYCAEPKIANPRCCCHRCVCSNFSSAQGTRIVACKPLP